MQIQIVEAPKLMSEDETWPVARVKAALAAGERVEIRGNYDRGWCAYIVGGDAPYDLLVSEVFHSDVGDTLAHCVDACEQVYGVTLPHNPHDDHNDRPARPIGAYPFDTHEAYGFNWHDDQS